MKRVVLLALAAIMLALPALGAISPIHTIEGVLTDNAGNPLGDGTYVLSVKLFTTPTGGTSVHSESQEVDQWEGVFRAELTGIAPALFDQDLWLEIGIYGEPPMVPRIRVNPVPVALRASTVDPANAVTSVNSQKGNVNIVGGTNVTVSNTTGMITISATAGAGGDDGDWEIVGENLYRTVGRVFVGEYKKAAGDATGHTTQTKEDGEKGIPASSKFEVQATNEGILSLMDDSNTLADGRAAIFGYRYGNTHNHGTGFGLDLSNAAITGYNRYGDSYTWGISGYTNFNYRNTAAILASDLLGSTWSALSFMDNDLHKWGLYSNSDLHTDGLTETQDLRVVGGAAAGYLLTSDAAGNASWQAPGAAVADDDWTISGSNMFHSTTGAVAIGTGDPHTWGDSVSATTLQVKALFSATLALDAQYPGNALHRWTMTGGSGGLQFNKSSAYASYGTTALRLYESGAELNNSSGGKRIALRTEADMDDGGAIELFGGLSANRTLHLDGSGIGGAGRIDVNDANGSSEVVITGNHNFTGVGRVTTPVLEITGGSDLSEQFDIGNSSGLTSPGMVVSIDPDNPGQLTLSGKAYDRRVAGVISGAGGVTTGMVMGQRGTVADGELPVALVGRVYVWADASEGAIEPGDLLTTSDRPGHAMKVADHGLAAGAILGKAMTGLKEGQGLILTLVSLQ